MFSKNTDISASPREAWRARVLARVNAISGDCIARAHLTFEAQSELRALIYRGPQGYGKSVLLAQNCLHFANDGNRFAYVSLAAGYDSEADLVAAICGQIYPRTQVGAPAVPKDFRQLATAMWQIDSLLMSPVLICVDDLDQGGDFVSRLEVFVTESPRNLHFAFAAVSRRGFAQLTLQTGVLEILLDDLSFSEKEVEAFSNTGKSYSADEMMHETRGWPALCKIMTGTEFPDDKASRWPETKRFFLEEIVPSLTEKHLRFLERAATIAPISSESFNYVFKTDDAAALMGDIAFDHNLLLRSKIHADIFLLHPALRDYFQERFLARTPERGSYFLKRAAFWHWRRREFQQAINLALRAGDHRWALGLSEDIMLDLALRQGEIEALRSLLIQVPKRAMQSNPAITLAYAWTLYFSQEASEAEKLLNAMPETRMNETSRIDRGWRQLVRAIGYATHDDLQLSETLCTNWISEFGNVNVVGKGAALTCLTFIMSSQSRFSELSKFLVLANPANTAGRQRFAFGWLHAAEIQAALNRGDMYGAQRLIEAARIDPNVQVERTPFSAKMLISFEAEASCELGMLEFSDDLVESYLEFAGKYGVTDILYRVCRVAAAWRRRTNDLRGALALLERVRALAQEKKLYRLETLIQMEIAELYIAEGIQGFDKAMPKESDPVFSGLHARPLRAQLSILRALAALRNGQYSLAVKNANEAGRTARAIDAGRLEVRALMCAAGAHAASESVPIARKVATEAYEMVLLLGCFQTAGDTRDLLAGLTITSDVAFTDLEFVVPAQKVETSDQLVGVRSLLPKSTRREGTTLSSKQIRVLRYVREGLSNKQIADRLLVREDTVKWHMRKIFADLNVRSRVQAVTEAQARNLI
jgi:LuxR family maltose regulon positive regulatory protein